MKRTIVFARFTEADVLAGKDVSGKVGLGNVITADIMLKGTPVRVGPAVLRGQ